MRLYYLCEFLIVAPGLTNTSLALSQTFSSTCLEVWDDTSGKEILFLPKYN